MKVKSMSSPIPASSQAKRVGNIFIELSMGQFPNSWKIPPHLRKLDENPDIWMDILLNLGPKKARLTAQAYQEYLSMCLFLEEIEEESRYSQFNVENIRFAYVANDTFQFKIDDQNSKLTKAIGENLLSCFTLHRRGKHHSSKSSDPISGEINSNRSQRNYHQDHQYIFVSLYADGHTVFDIKELCSENLYDVKFHGNRTTYLYQHHALDFVKKHQLFDCLVNNELYCKTLPECHINHEDYIYR